MREFFRGWRRKVGCLLLVMACLFMGLRVRSRFYEDDLRFRMSPHSIQILQLFQKGLGWASSWEPEDGPRMIRENGAVSCTVLMDGENSIQWESAPRSGSDSDVLERVQWILSLGGCSYGHELDDPKSGVGSRILLVSYSTLVLSLTLLSGYLICWQPRKRAPSGSIALPPHSSGNDHQSRAAGHDQ